MRIAAISDIHGNLVALEAVLKAVEEEKPDTLVVLGDLVAFGPHPNAVLDRIRALGDVPVIRGNCDRYVLEMESPSDHLIWEAIWWTKNALSADHLRYLASLKATQTLAADGVSILLCHGDPNSDDGGFFPNQEDDFAKKLSTATEQGVLCGHTHRPLWRTIGQQVLINDGSAGFPYDGDPRPSFAVCDIQKGQISNVRLQRVAYDTKMVSDQLCQLDLAMARLMSKRVLVGKMLR